MILRIMKLTRKEQGKGVGNAGRERAGSPIPTLYSGLSAGSGETLSRPIIQQYKYSKKSEQRRKTGKSPS